MHLDMYEYIEVNLVGVAMLFTMLFYIRKRHSNIRGEEKPFFTRMLILNALILLADNCIYLMRGHGAEPLIILNHGICMAYFIMTGWFCYYWICYAMARLYPGERLTFIKRLLLVLPAAVSTAVIAVTPWTGWIYILSADNVYHRGPLMGIAFGTAIIYWIVSTVIVVREGTNPRRSRNSGEYWTLLIFPIPLVIGNILQLCFYGLSIVWVLAAISMLILFIDMQNDQMSRDELTGLFNRRQTNAQLLWEVRRLHSSDSLLMVAMIDVDHFKRINDSCGHLCGDKALIFVAETLKKSCRKSDFIGRFGGDEFLMICHVDTEESAGRIMRRIDARLDMERLPEGIDRKITVSAGCAIYRSTDEVTVDSILNEADKKMYAEKNLRKSLDI